MPTETPPAGRQDAYVIALIGFVHGVSLFFHLLLPPLFPWLMPEFGLDFTAVGSTMTVFFVVSGVGQAQAGWLVDRFGPVRVLAGGIACFLLAGLGLDFGMAKILSDGTLGVAPLAQSISTTAPVFSPPYAAPEQFDGSAPISAQTDLFALAHITYTMLVGAPYWAEEMDSSPSLYGFLMAMQNPDTEPPTRRAARRRAQLPPAFDAWFARATAKRAQDRFRSGAEQHAALEQVFAGVGRAATVAGAPIGYTGQGTPAGGYAGQGTPGGGYPRSARSRARCTAARMKRS